MSSTTCACEARAAADRRTHAARGVPSSRSSRALLGQLLATVVQSIAHLPIRHARHVLRQPRACRCVVRVVHDGRDARCRDHAGERARAAHGPGGGLLQGLPRDRPRRRRDRSSRRACRCCAADTRFGFEEFSRRAGDYALAMCLAVIRLDGGKVVEARIGVGGAEPFPRRIAEAEADPRRPAVRQGRVPARRRGRRQGRRSDERRAGRSGVPARSRSGDGAPRAGAVPAMSADHSAKHADRLGRPLDPAARGRVAGAGRRLLHRRSAGRLCTSASCAAPSLRAASRTSRCRMAAVALTAEGSRGTSAGSSRCCTGRTMSPSSSRCWPMASCASSASRSRPSSRAPPAEAEDLVEATFFDIEETRAGRRCDAPRCRPDAPRVHDWTKHNVLVEGRVDTPGFDDVMAAAAHVVEIEITSRRQNATPLETRGAHAAYDARTGRITLTCSTQSPHVMRTAIAELLRHARSGPARRRARCRRRLRPEDDAAAGVCRRRAPVPHAAALGRLDRGPAREPDRLVPRPRHAREGEGRVRRRGQADRDRCARWPRTSAPTRVFRSPAASRR